MRSPARPPASPSTCVKRAHSCVCTHVHVRMLCMTFEKWHDWAKEENGRKSRAKHPTS